MITGFRSILSVARLGLIAVAMTACGTVSSLSPSTSTTTLMAGWERHFTLQWTVEAKPDGARRLDGYVYNTYGGNAQSVRLLGQALDRSGAIVGQRIVWVPEGVGGFGRTYFEIPDLPASDHYRVSVWDYSFFQAGLRP
jgi:hypothetical protein